MDLNINNVTTCKTLSNVFYPIGTIVPFKIMYDNRYSFLRDFKKINDWDGWSGENGNDYFLKHFELIYESSEDLSYLIPLLTKYDIT